MMKKDLSTWFASASTPILAKHLLGAKLVVGGRTGWLVETDAYVGETDRAAHAFAGKRTKTNQALWAAPGTVYVYHMRQYFLLNIVTQAVGTPEGILLRAAEPATGLAEMQAARGKTTALANGPGKLCQAFGVDLTDNWRPLGTGRVTIDWQAQRTPARIIAAPRVGVPNKGVATTALLRFYVAGNPAVSAIKRRDIDLRTKGWRS